jgi:hypothetical protein
MVFRYALVLVLASAMLFRCRSAFIGVLLLPATFRLYRMDEGADVIAAFGLLVAVDALARYFDTGDRRWFGLSALGAMFLAGSKHEGQILLLALAGAAALQFLRMRDRRRSLRWHLLWLAAPAVAIASTWWFNRRFDVWNAVLASQSDGLTFVERLLKHLPERGPAFLTMSRDIMAGTGLDSRFLHLAFLVLLISCPLAAFSRRMGIMTVTVLLAWGAMVPIFLGTPYPFGWFAHVALARVMDQWSPVICVWIAGLAHELGPPGARPAVKYGVALRRVLLGICIAGAAIGPLVRLWQVNLPRMIPWAVGVMRMTEDEKLALYMGPGWEALRAARDRSPVSTPLIFVLPQIPEAAEGWARFTGLLYPKKVIGYVPGAAFVTPELRKFEIEYENTLEGVVALAGPVFDVVVFEKSAELPKRLELDVWERGNGYTLAHGRLTPGGAASR